jgi:DNA-binding Lrp family transcriptional regulator
MKQSIDSKDIAILSCLRINAREKLKKIAKDVKLPISTVYDRIKKMESEGVIKKYSCLIEPKKMNHSIKTKILFKIPGDLKAKFEAQEVNSPFLNSLLKLTGGEWNYMAEGFFQNIDHMCNYTEKLTKEYPESQHQIHYIINELKQEDFLVDSK